MGTRQTVRRAGPTTIAEQNLVTALVLDSPVELNSKQVNGLAKALRRPVATVKSMIEKAQLSFRSKAERYVEIHMQATEQALAHGSVNGLEVASKNAAWALERLSGEGVRVIEPKPTTGENGPVGPRVMIGIRVGGLKQASDETLPETINVTATEVAE